jgi:hypothetical protein
MAYARLGPSYDVIGEIHGQRAALERLFDKLGYAKTAGGQNAVRRRRDHQHAP